MSFLLNTPPKRMPALLMALVWGMSLLSGCAPGPGTAPDEVARQVEAHRQVTNSATEAMKPMLGRWTVNVQATLARIHFYLMRSSPISGAILNKIHSNCRLPPPATQAAARKTESDHYVVSDVRGGVVTLNLQSAEHDEDSHHRKVRLLVRDGTLIIRTSRWFSCVMTPSAAANQ